MSLGEPFTGTTRTTPSAPMRETFSAPAMLPICCLCGLIRDKAGTTSDLVRWITARTYCETHGVNPADIPLTHTYCPNCFTKVQETVVQYFRQLGTPP